MTQYTFRKQLNRITYSLTEDGVAITSKDFFHGQNKTLIEYDKIGHHPTYFCNVSRVAFGGAILLGIIAVMTFYIFSTGGDMDKMTPIMYLVFSLCCLAYYCSKRNEGVQLGSTRGSLVILGKKKKTLPFAEHVTAAQLDSILRKLERRKEVMESEEIIKYLLFLQDSSVISEKSYLTLQNQLMKKSNSFAGFSN